MAVALISHVCKMSVLLDKNYFRAEGYNPGPVMPSTADGTQLSNAILPHGHKVSAPVAFSF